MKALKAFYGWCLLVIPTWSILSFQDRASPIIEELTNFHDTTIVIIIIITALVGVKITLILTYNITDRFLLQNQNTEIIWTILPVFILLLIAAPSLKVLYLTDDPWNPNLTIKAVGHQWYWEYEYSDLPDLVFDSYIIPQIGTPENSARLLDVDNSLVVPLNRQTQIITTAADVIHSWTIPSIGLKADAVPGRLNQIIFLPVRTGVYYGQCSEICGANHRFMPIKIEIVPMNIFSKWIK